MARPLRINYPGAFYHVTSRGNERKNVFKSKRDREKFFEYLDSATQRYDAVIHVFCLMDNHYHLLIETPSGNLPQIMRHINRIHQGQVLILDRMKSVIKNQGLNPFFIFLAAVTDMTGVEALENALEGNVSPKTLQINRDALKRGYELGLQSLTTPW